MAQLDFSRAYIVIQYHSRNTAADPVTKKSFRLNFRGNTINFFQNQFDSNYSNALTNSNFTTGDEKIYIKGGNGSVAFIDLFGNIDDDNNGVSDELDFLRSNNWLINDAIITFFVSNENQKQPKRIFLFDATNNVPLLDYFQDVTTSGDTKNNKFVFGGLLESEESVGGVKYRFRIRAHIDKILNSSNTNDLRNVRLGLAVTENINSINEIPNNTTDWLLVELRDAINNNLVVAQKAALVLNDGTVVDTATNSRELRAGFPVAIGYQRVSGSLYFAGYIQDVRISNGLARYTANFTPPTSSLEG